MITEKLHIDRIDFALMFKDLEVAKTRIIYKLINKERNRELLEKAPHVEYLDLAIVFYYLFPVTMRMSLRASCLIMSICLCLILA